MLIFLTVDADIEYDSKTIELYKKNGFIINNKVQEDKLKVLKDSKKETSTLKTISMRLDILVAEDAEEEDLTGSTKVAI